VLVSIDTCEFQITSYLTGMGLPFQRSLKGRKQVRATGRNSARNKTKTSGYLSGELRSRSVTIMNTLSL